MDHGGEDRTMKSYIQLGIAGSITGFEIVGQRPIPGQDLNIFPCPVGDGANNIPGKFRTRAETTYVTANA